MCDGGAWFKVARKSSIEISCWSALNQNQTRIPFGLRPSKTYDDVNFDWVDFGFGAICSAWAWQWLSASCNQTHFRHQFIHVYSSGVLSKFLAHCIYHIFSFDPFTNPWQLHCHSHLVGHLTENIEIELDLNGVLPFGKMQPFHAVLQAAQQLFECAVRLLSLGD